MRKVFFLSTSTNKVTKGPYGHCQILARLLLFACNHTHGIVQFHTSSSCKGLQCRVWGGQRNCPLRFFRVFESFLDTKVLSSVITLAMETIVSARTFIVYNH